MKETQTSKKLRKGKIFNSASKGNGCIVIYKLQLSFRI